MLHGGLLGAIVFGPIWYLDSGELFVAIIAAGVGAFIGIFAVRYVSKTGCIAIVVVVGLVWLNVYLGKHGYPHLIF